MTYPTVQNEVNAIDFIGLETVRIFSAQTYRVIRDNKEEFVGSSREMSFPRQVDQEDRPFHQVWVAAIDSGVREAISGIVQQLFPRVRAALSNQGFHAGDAELRWRRARRICSSELFGLYFQLALPEGVKSVPEVQALVALTADQERLTSRLRELASVRTAAGRTEASGYLEELLTYAEAIPKSSIPAIVHTFFDMGDELLIEEDETGVFLGYGNDVRIGQILWQLLPRLEADERFDVLRSALLDATSIALPVREVAILGQQHGKYGADRPSSLEGRFVTEEELEELESMAVEKIRAAASSSQLAHAPELPRILYRWRDWGSPHEAQGWVQQLIATNQGLLLVLRSFVSRSQVHTSDEIVARTRIQMNVKSLVDFLDVENAYGRAREILEHERSLTTSDREVLQIFVSAYNNRDDDLAE